jgi:hypothetical protein
MADTTSWAWTGSGTWPSFRVRDNNNADASGNGRAIPPSGYTSITWRDGNNDGVINDNDSGDGTTAGTDRVVIGGISKTVHEVATYLNSTFVMNGVTYTVPMDVWIFTDGTYMVSVRDAEMPFGNHLNITQINLGTWNGTEYGGSNVSTRVDPFVCFTAGTLVETPVGPRRVESLEPGDLVQTLDHGPQPLRWIGIRSVAGRGENAPILIRNGALGNSADLRVSPQHRVLITGWRAELFAGCDEVLASAHHLVDDGRILRAPCDRVTYVHLLFDRHEILETSGLFSESFHPAAYGLSLLDAPQIAEVVRLFPGLARDACSYGPTARTCLRSWETALMVAC